MSWSRRAAGRPSPRSEHGLDGPRGARCGVLNAARGRFDTSSLAFFCFFLVSCSEIFFKGCLSWLACFCLSHAFFLVLESDCFCSCFNVLLVAAPNEAAKSFFPCLCGSPIHSGSPLGSCWAFAGKVVGVPNFAARPIFRQLCPLAGFSVFRWPATHPVCP